MHVQWFQKKQTDALKLTLKKRKTIYFWNRSNYETTCLMQTYFYFKHLLQTLKYWSEWRKETYFISSSFKFSIRRISITKDVEVTDKGEGPKNQT